MNNLRLISAIVIGRACVLLSGHADGATIQTQGAGSAVSFVDRSANFDVLTANNVIHLEAYREGGLGIMTSGTSWADDLNSAARLDPFHQPGGTDGGFYAVAWGNEDWVTIQTTNLTRMYGVEFMYGNCWTTGDIYGQYP